MVSSPLQALHELLREAAACGASDLHLTSDARPTARISGTLVPLREQVTTGDDCTAIIHALLTDDLRSTYARCGEVDFSYSDPGIPRCRMHVYRQRGVPSLAVRLIPSAAPAFTSLALPPQIERFAHCESGLVLVAGPTGSGKSTTLAALIDSINGTQRKHIVTLEDPIEYVHNHRQSLIEQREIGVDTQSFASGLRAALRADPDVILVGEMRDLETISIAITAAETGHLVFATLHTRDAAQSINRIIDVFPAAQQTQIRIQLASVLIAVVCQRLLPTPDGRARVAVCEILVNNSAVANLIRTANVHQLKSVMQTGRQLGMQTMEMHVKELVMARRVSERAATRLIAEHQGLDAR